MCKTIGKHNEPHSTVEDVVKRAIEDALGDYIGRGQADVGGVEDKRQAIKDSFRTAIPSTVVSHTTSTMGSNTA